MSLTIGMPVKKEILNEYHECVEGKKILKILLEPTRPSFLTEFSHRLLQKLK